MRCRAAKVRERLLVKCLRFGPSRKVCDGVYLSKKLTDDFTRVITLAQSLDLFHRAREGVFGLRNRRVRVVLALPLEAVMMFQEFFAEELREALTDRSVQWPCQAREVDVHLTTLRGHLLKRQPDPV